ncbi:hypothetical protein MAPG_03880 [Magnaporthiopsis poae ATCC 64411]|uniref:Copper acquisition factor BIM1-like domain-containing protein n=1 Tax=Magnaporthiopsis poae (strain ATCC 64411 / 73-15) TaxID=644358 RepID=A0A0C4DV79_MAGP6|nr:hypothetical protein MAPG_03880 [Magnaporthiopsis poae ATCC 64411]
MLVSAILLVAALAASPGSAHFLLRLPPSMGYLLDTTGVAPCGGFSFSGNVSGHNYPVKGYPFAATSTVHNVTYTVKVRLLKDPQDTFHEILPPVFVNHYGTFCLPSVPVNRSWIGEPAEYHVVSNDVTSTTYQCSVIRFTDQDAFNSSTRAECKNTSNVIGNLQPWGSNVTTSPTLSTPSVTLAPMPTDSMGAGSRLMGSKLDPWLSAGFSIALGALPFVL